VSGRLRALLVVICVLGGPIPAPAGPLRAWLAVQDPVEPCPAIAVLNGDQPSRVVEAARLYQVGAGQEIWLTNDPRSGNPAVTDAGTQSNAQYLAGRAGVPSSAIHILPGAATGTRAELAIVVDELRRRELSCAILVTSPLHARRVKATWEHIAGSAPRAVVRHAAGGGHIGWWVELTELGGTLLARIGLAR
jgi:uncharacterized SAM-binding protein YcdF (DUF218 family)